MYSVMHILTGIYYIGWTSQTINKRWNEHCSYKENRSDTYFHRALRKYGKENFEWNVIQYFTSIEEAKQAEIFWIAYLKECGIVLYNRTDGGDGVTGFTHSKETIQILSKSITGDKNPMYGKNHTNEAKQKISDALKGKSISNETRLSRFGKHHTDETKLKLSVINKDKRPHVKLTWNEVNQIRELRTGGASYNELSIRFKVHRETISLICKNKRWKIRLTET